MTSSYLGFVRRATASLLSSRLSFLAISVGLFGMLGRNERYQEKEFEQRTSESHAVPRHLRRMDPPVMWSVQFKRTILLCLIREMHSVTEITRERDGNQQHEIVRRKGHKCAVGGAMGSRDCLSSPPKPFS